jgi:hypothetical protein
MNDPKTVPHPPYEQLRRDLSHDPAAGEALDALHAHLHGPAPEPATVQRHVDVLRGVRTVEARIANWWDDPVTQTWIKALSDAGL